MAVFKSLTFDGENSLDYGVYITGEAVYNAPGRVVDMVTIPGRNGSLAIDQGRFENIEVTYPAGAFGTTQTEYSSVMRAFRNFLASRYRYVRLEDDYHPDEYRLGLFKSGLEVDPVSMSRAGEFDIVFDCKPQRFLKSGEVPVSGADWTNVQTASGSVVTIDNSGDPLGIKSLTASIEPVQSGSGTTSPTNVRPISGRTEVNTYVSGSQLINTSTNQNGALDASGNEVSNASFNRTDYIPVSSGNIYIKGEVASGYTIRVHGYSSSKSWVEQLCDISTDGSSLDVSEVVPSGIDYVRISYPLNAVNTLNLYQGTSHTTSLGRTVYGGTLDVNTGLLTVTYGLTTVGALNWSYNSGGYLYASISAAVSLPPKKNGNSNLLCDTYATTSQTSVSTMENFSIKGNANTTNVYIKDSNYTNAATFKTEKGNVVIAYELATPETYQLTPQEIDLLLGDNNIWASSGDVTVEYGQSPFYNPTEFPSKPLIKVTGTGTLVVGGVTITITGVASQTIYIDCESMEIYKIVDGEVQSAASLVTFSGNDFPVLSAGNTGVSYGSGITALEITPHWWRI